MPLNRTNTAPPRELPTAETHQAICCGHYHIGTQRSEKYDKDSEQIILSFALLDDRRSDGSYFYVSTSSLTLSFGEKANLAKLIKGWLGKVPGIGEDFDTSTLVGRQCLLTIAHNKNDNGTFANIAGVMSLPRNMPQAAFDGDEIDYSPINPHEPIPENVPEWIKTKIQQSIEWQNVHGPDDGQPPRSSGNGNSNGHKPTNGAAAQKPPGNVYNAPPEKPPMVVKPYLAVIGLKWPYKVHELDEALERALQNPNNTADEIQEARTVLEPHADTVPF